MVRWKGEGADRCRWQMQGGGRSKNNEQTRLRPKLPQYATIVFSGRTRRVRVLQEKYLYKQKNDIRLDVVFMVQKEILNPNC